MNQYPTKKEILTNPIKHNKKTIEITKLWKQLAFNDWKKDNDQIKLAKLEILISALATINHKRTVKITYSIEYKYNPRKKTIYQNINHPSIISALHELAHHLYGPSELQACKWSISLFQKCFPESYKKLTWKNHMLIKTE